MRIDDEQHAVDHVHDALDFAAEIGVAGSVDDVDVIIVVFEGGVLGANGDAFFAFEIHRVHDAFLHLLVGAEGAGLMQQTIDERRLAVIDVGDDGDVANFFHDVIASLDVEQAGTLGGDCSSRSGCLRGARNMDATASVNRRERQKRQAICMTCRLLLVC